MLTLLIFLPLLTGVAVLFVPRAHPRWARLLALGGSLLALVVALALALGFDTGDAALQWRMQAPWIPGIGASYDVAVNGISLSLIVLTTLLLVTIMIYVLPNRDRVRAHAFLFLLLATGLLGLFAAQDLLLFYVFFEIALVPMYFIIGMWGAARRRYAAVKFFLYTRAGSLAMLLGFLALYLSMTPHTFSLPAMIAAQPLAHAPLAADAVFFALLLGFGVKLPIVPLHNWLPDAHVEAPTEGSVILAGVQLKMGGYGLIAVLLPVLPRATARFGWLLVTIALVSLLYAALAALAQRDLKRLIAYTSVSHMAFVTLAVGIAALVADPSVRQLALSGAVVQMVSHGLLTGGMFLLVGILQHRTETRDMDHLGGLFARAPRYSFLLALFAFGSLGLPGLSGFIGEFQVIGASLGLGLGVAVLAVLGIVLSTAVYLRVLNDVLMGPAAASARFTPLRAYETWAIAPLTIGTLAIGVLPAFIIGALDDPTRLLAIIAATAHP